MRHHLSTRRKAFIITTIIPLVLALATSATAGMSIAFIQEPPHVAIPVTVRAPLVTRQGVARDPRPQEVVRHVPLQEARGHTVAPVEHEAVSGDGSGSCIASEYYDGHSSSGMAEVGMYAANRTAPYGSRWRLWNANGSVVVTVVDRGPWGIPGRCWDIAPAGMRVLGGDGITRVSYERVG